MVSPCSQRLSCRSARADSAAVTKPVLLQPLPCWMPTSTADPQSRAQAQGRAARIRFSADEQLRQWMVWLLYRSISAVVLCRGGRGCPAKGSPPLAFNQRCRAAT